MSIPSQKKRKPKKLPKILSREDVKKILTVPNQNCTIGLRNRAILQVLYRAGLRVQELCNLMVEDIDIKNGYIYVQQGKNSKDRNVPIDNETIFLCQKWAALRPAGSDWFFPTLKNSQMSQRYVRDMIYRYAKKAGVYIRDGKAKKLPSCHTFRHCCMTELLEDGYSLAEVKNIAGHESIQTTSIYLSVRPEALAAKIRNRPAIGI